MAERTFKELKDADLEEIAANLPQIPKDGAHRQRYVEDLRDWLGLAFIAWEQNKPVRVIGKGSREKAQAVTKSVRQLNRDLSEALSILEEINEPDPEKLYGQISKTSKYLKSLQRHLDKALRLSLKASLPKKSSGGRRDDLRAVVRVLIVYWDCLYDFEGMKKKATLNRTTRCFKFVTTVLDKMGIGYVRSTIEKFDVDELLRGS